MQLIGRTQQRRVLGLRNLEKDLNQWSVNNVLFALVGPTHFKSLGPTLGPTTVLVVLGLSSQGTGYYIPYIVVLGGWQTRPAGTEFAPGRAGPPT
jgi:hypothetical protein